MLKHAASVAWILHFELGYVTPGRPERSTIVPGDRTQKTPEMAVVFGARMKLHWKRGYRTGIQ